MAQIQPVVTRSVEQSVNDIATNVSRAVVQAMTTSPTAGNPVVPPAISDATAECTVDASLEGSTAASGSFPRAETNVKQIQSGEFFELSKFLRKNFSVVTKDEPVVLTLENSVKKVKLSQPATNITDIEQWTIAFTICMSERTDT